MDDEKMDDEIIDEEQLKIYAIICTLANTDKNNLTKDNLIYDEKGYLYCIYNSIYDVYDIEILKVGNSCNLKERYRDYKYMYIDDIEVKNELYVPFKYTFEYLLFFSLNKNRVYQKREYFTKYEEINDEFKIIENIMKQDELTDTEKLKKYLVYVLKKFNITNINDYETPKDMNVKLVNKKTINYNVLQKKENIKYEYKMSKSGYIHILEIPEINYNFNNKVQYICVSPKQIIKYLTEFLFPIKTKKKISVKNTYIAKIILKDMLCKKTIKNNYYECDEKIAIDVMGKINEYFINYEEENVLNAYLYDMYKIGNKVISKNFIITDKNKYGYSRMHIHKRLMEMIDDNEEKEVNIITDDLKKSLNKNILVDDKKSLIKNNKCLYENI